MNEQRPDPDKLLKNIQQEERQQQRGKLKIYLGAAPGVGKTYTMLQDAHALCTQGLDVIVGVVESHSRIEIENLLKNLEILPRQSIAYRGKQLSEFDLDGALKRNPGLILIDEMAHTNAPGLRHTKRWQDIKEILDRGIDVYTTLNVQHIESLNDIVSQIIQTRIKETVPDSMLELAETIELVDLAPEDLLKRLEEGKVYFPAQADLAVGHFFKKGNLIALRELALRYTAEVVESQVLLYRQGQKIERIWPTKQRLLVCVGPGPEAAKIIRTAKRMAASLQAEWFAAYVETPQRRLSEDEHNNIVKNLRLAEQLGAETMFLEGLDIVKEIIQISHERNISRIIVWKKTRPRWKDILFNSIADELVRRSGEIDVYIITGEIEKNIPAKPKTITPKKRRIPWLDYGIAIVTVFLTTFVNYLLYPHVGLSNLIMLYLFGVVIVAMGGWTGPSILASVLSVLAFDFFFIPPLFTFSLSDIQYLITLIIMLLVAQVISHLTILTQRQAKAAHHAARRATILHALSRQLANTRGVDKLLTVAVRYISEVFDSEVIALLPENGHVTVRTKFKTDQNLDAKELSMAQWVYDLGQVAGLGTDTLTFSDSLYVPMISSQGSAGVLRLKPLHPEILFTPDQMHLLESCANQIGLALEVDKLQEQAKKQELKTETDRVRSILLESVSLNLRSPLIAIMGHASTLTEMSKDLEAKIIKKLGKDIYTESEQLNRLINNVLQMTYLETNAVKLQKEPCILSDLINDVLNKLNKQLRKRQVNIQLPDNLPEIPLDKILIEEVIINLLDNAIKFSPSDTLIEISATTESDKIELKIEDRGPGLVTDEADKLFEKYYRGRMLKTERGMGLGLAICRSIIKVHGGEIWAANRIEGGASFHFTIPLQ